MGNNSVFALMFIVMLAIVVVPIAITNLANANFAFPPANPNITFYSPVNTTYTTNNISLKVTFDTYKTGMWGAPEDDSLRKFSYSIDGGDFQPIEITNSSIGKYPGNDVQFDGVINLLQLSEGNHTLTVKVELDYGYPPAYDLPPTLHTKSTANAYILIDAIPDILENELAIPIIAAVALIAVSISVYFLRLKR